MMRNGEDHVDDNGDDDGGDDDDNDDDDDDHHHHLGTSRNHEIGCCNGRIALKFYRHLDSSAVGVPVKFQSDWKSLNPTLASSSRHEILR